MKDNGHERKAILYSRKTRNTNQITILVFGKKMSLFKYWSKHKPFGLWYWESLINIKVSKWGLVDN